MNDVDRSAPPVPDAEATFSPAAFRGDPTDWPVLLARAPFALMSHGAADGMPLASWLPLRPTGGARAPVEGHLARVNPLAAAIRDAGAEGLPVTVAVLGAHGYVSPRWYRGATPAVPTWNYEAAFLSGRAVALTDAAEAADLVARLADDFEAGVAAQGAPWRFADQPEAFRAGMVNGITAFHMTVTAATVKRKLSQNRSPADRDGVVAGLRASGRALDRDLAAAMTQVSGLTD